MVEESQREVEVSLYDDAKDPEQACIQVLKPGCAIVKLEEPLGKRRAVDGAQNAAAQKPVPLERFGPCRPVPSHSRGD